MIATQRWRVAGWGRSDMVGAAVLLRGGSGIEALRIGTSLIRPR